MRRSDVEQAELLGRRRVKVMAVLTAVYMFQKVSGVDANTGQMGQKIMIAAWIAVTLVLLMLLISSRLWSRSEAVRALLDDEVTQANRMVAVSFGFTVMVVLGLITYLIPVPGWSVRTAVSFLISCGLITSSLSFALLEWRDQGRG